MKILALSHLLADIGSAYRCRDEDTSLVELRGVAAVVRISNFLYDYDRLIKAVAEALNSPAQRIVLYIDSSGGDVHGCFAASRAMRGMIAASGKESIAFIDGVGASAAYAMACAASKIVCTETSQVGSVGVLACRVDAAAAAAAHGVVVYCTSSGAKKSYGNPDVPMSEAELADTQSRVDYLADLFFHLVAESRSIDAEAVKGLQAGVFVGRQALTNGLVDSVDILESLLTQVTDKETGVTLAEMKAALAAIVDDKDAKPEDSASAKRMLAAMDEPKLEDEPKKDDEPVKDAAVSGLVKVVASLKSELEAMKSAQTEGEKKTLMASRPDLPQELVAYLQEKSVEDCKAFLAAMPKLTRVGAASQTVPPLNPKSPELDEPKSEDAETEKMIARSFNMLKLEAPASTKKEQRLSHIGRGKS